MKEKSSFWSRWSGRYDAFMRAQAPLYDAVAERIRPQLGRTANVLELACGTGLISQRLAGSVRDLEATDLAPEMIAQAQKKPHSARVHYSVQNAESLPYGDETFDAVVIVNALHIMPRPEKVLAEARRVLKKGGVLIAPTFVHGRRSGLRSKLMHLAGFRVFHRWNAEEFARFVGENGFHVQQTAMLGSSIAPLCYLEATSG